MRAVILAVLSLACLTGMLSPRVADAQQPQSGPACGNRAKIIAILAKQYKEVPRAIALGKDGSSVMEIYISPEGTWTALVTTAADNKTCIVASGERWEDIAIKPAGTAI